MPWWICLLSCTIWLGRIPPFFFTMCALARYMSEVTRMIRKIHPTSDTGLEIASGASTTCVYLLFMAIRDDMASGCVEQFENSQWSCFVLLLCVLQMCMRGLCGLCTCALFVHRGCLNPSVWDRGVRRSEGSCQDKGICGRVWARARDYSRIRRAGQIN